MIRGIILSLSRKVKDLLRMDVPTDRRPVPFRTRVEKSGKYTPRYPVRTPKAVRNGTLKCVKAQNPRTFKKGRVRIYGSKEDVYRRRALSTRGGLRRADLESRQVYVDGALRRMVFKRNFHAPVSAARRQQRRQTPVL